MTAALGGVLVLAGLLGNEWLIRAALMPEFRLSPAGRTGWLIIELLLLGWGVLCLLRRRNPRLQRLNRWLVLLALALPLVLEGLLRLGIALEIERFRDPGLYADWSSEDEYWRLLWHWNPTGQAPGGAALPAAGEVHPRLGWVPPRSQDNPLGIIGYDPARTGHASAPVLFLGDSFVAGIDSGSSLPALLDQRLPGRVVHNLGVGGYGLGQILLRLGAALQAFESPAVLVGVLTTDLDRSVLTVRTGPKPHFVLQGDELELRGVPVPADPHAWLRANPPQTSSFLLAWLTRRFRGLAAGGDPLAAAHRREEKQQLNARVLDEIADECRKAGAPLGFVIFHTLGELDRPGWRVRFLRRELARRGLPFVDTLKALRAGGQAREQYDPQHQHLTPEGTRRVAEAIVEDFGWLRGTADQEGAPPEPPPPPPPEPPPLPEP